MRTLSANFIVALIALISMINISNAYSCKVCTPRSVITGSGLLHPSGSTAAALMDAALETVGRSMERQLSVFDALEELFDSNTYPRGKQVARSRSSTNKDEIDPSSSSAQAQSSSSVATRMLTLNVDIRTSTNAYQIVADLPGVEKGDIQVDVKNDVLTVSAERKSTPLAEGEQYHRNERLSGVATRTFSLPEDADKDNITAKYENGVLTVGIPRIPAAPVPEKKSIPIN
jgi:HSP20 family protein